MYVALHEMMWHGAMLYGFAIFKVKVKITVVAYTVNQNMIFNHIIYI